jgi:hypothetical protein
LDQLESRILLATQFLVQGFPSPVTAGLAETVSVTAENADGSVDTSYSGTVHFTSSDSKALLPPDSTLTSGMGSFSVTLETAGTQSITATDTMDSTITGSQTGIMVDPAAASVLVVSGFPSPSTAGMAGSVTVTAEDPFGNTDTNYTGTVHFTSSDTKAVLPADSMLTSGVGTFSVTLKTAGTQSITATDMMDSTITGSQTGIMVDPAAASVLVVSGFPSPSTAGVAGNVTVTAEDPFGNTDTNYTGTVHFTSSDTKAVLPADSMLASGVGTFSVTLKTAGTQSITATDTMDNTITGSQTGIMVDPAAASALVVSGFPSPSTAGVAGNITVTVEDAFGNTATGYTGTVHFTSSDTKAVLPANGTLTSGVGTFSVTLKTAGTQSITATDTVTSTITGSQTGITVDPGAASVLVVNGFPSPSTAGVAGNVTVTAEDAFGNTATGYTGTVHFTSSDAKAVLPADSTLTTGVGTFSVTLKTAGTQSIKATDTVTSTITGSQTGITVNPAAASVLVVSGFPSPSTAGVPGSVTVTAEDAFGNTATGYTGMVHFTSSDAKAVLPADSTLTSGVGTFTVTLKTAGTQSITATDTVTSSITGSQTGITVNPAAASVLVVSGFPSPATAGVAGNVTVTAQDVFGNTATGYTGTVHFSSSDPLASLPGDHTFVASDAGTHTFSVTLNTAGTQSITVTDTVTPSITGTQSGITVSQASDTNLAFLQRVYHDLLGRGLDPVGQAGWLGFLNAGVSRTQVVYDIETCATEEYQTDEINKAYMQLLGRAVDASGLQSGLYVLAHWGLETEYEFIASQQEYFQNRGGGNIDTWLTAVYQDAFHRAVDPGARTAFDQELNGGIISLRQAADIIFSSQEYQQDLVDSYYSMFLLRSADVGGQAGFVAQLQAGVSPEHVIAAIVGSPEYFSLV